jgi:hypothetical protein
VKIHTFQEGAINTMFVFKNQLYVGTYKHGSIYRSPDGVNWQLVWNGSTYAMPYAVVWSFAQYNNGSGEAIYAGVGGNFASNTSKAQGAIFKSYDGLTWTQVLNTTSIDQTQVTSLAVWNNRLYAFTLNGTIGYTVYATNDITWHIEDISYGATASGVKGDTLYAGDSSGWICWRNTTSLWTCKGSVLLDMVSGITPFNNVLYLSGGKQIKNASDDLSTNYVVKTITDSSISALFPTSRALYASSGNNFGEVFSTPNGTDWLTAYSPSLNCSWGFALFNATGDWRLYVGIAGPNWNIVNGGQAYLYRSTFTS